MSATVFDERVDPGRAASAALSLVVHLLLVAVLVFGVSWQNRPAATVTAELWEAPTFTPPAPQPRVEPPKPAPRVEEPPPPKPEPKIEKPDIVEKAPPKIKPAPPKAEPKPAPLKPRVDESKRRMEQELAREQASLAVDRERARLQDQLAREAAALNSKALQTWIGKIQTQIRSRINKGIADDVPGNPEAVFMVTLLPNCEVLKISKLKPSGNPAYDDEVERAILRASPLPRPDKAEVFSRELRLTFRPKDPI